jgi:hypothetical protein
VVNFSKHVLFAFDVFNLAKLENVALLQHLQGIVFAITFVLDVTNPSKASRSCEQRTRLKCMHKLIMCLKKNLLTKSHPNLKVTELKVLQEWVLGFLVLLLGLLGEQIHFLFACPYFFFLG